MESKHYLQSLTGKTRQFMASALATLASSKALVTLINRYTGETDEQKKKLILLEIKAMENRNSPPKANHCKLVIMRKHSIPERA